MALVRIRCWFEFDISSNSMFGRIWFLMHFVVGLLEYGSSFNTHLCRVLHTHKFPIHWPIDLTIALWGLSICCTSLATCMYSMLRLWLHLVSRFNSSWGGSRGGSRCDSRVVLEVAWWVCLPRLVVLCVYPVWWSILFTRLVVHCVYPIWWSIVFIPFGGPLCLRTPLVVHCVYTTWWPIVFTSFSGPLC